MVSGDISIKAGVGGRSRHRTRALTWYIVVFSVAFFVFVMGPPFLGYKFPPYPLMHVADIFDLFTPLVLIPLYWLLFRLDPNRAATNRETVAFLVFSAIFVLGQGMHLAANSIGHLTEGMAGTDVYKLTSLYDETLSHYVWHIGVLGLSAVIAFRQSRNFFETSQFDWKVMIGALIYGFTYFAMVVEGATLLMGLPLAALFVATCLLFARRGLSRQPTLYFFLLAYSISILLFATWGIWQGGFPEFSEVGIIN